jgi:hypothetical protein
MKMDVRNGERELVDAFRRMAPEAQKILLEVARRYECEFPAQLPVTLRLVKVGDRGR